MFETLEHRQLLSVGLQPHPFVDLARTVVTPVQAKLVHVSIAPYLITTNTTANLTVNLSTPVNRQISITVFTADRTAQANINYLPIQKTIVFAPNQTSITIPVTVLQGNAVDSWFAVNITHVVDKARRAGVAQRIAFVVVPASNVPVGNQIIKPVELTGMMPNPNTGYQTFYESSANDPNTRNGTVKSNTYYTRFDWSDIEPSLGNYNWTPIDREYAAAQAVGQKFALRIMPFEDGNAGPSAYKNAGLPGFSFSVQGVNTWVPDYNNPTVQSHILKFINALGTRYGNHNLDSVDIGMVGRWGEMHYYQCSPQPPRPTLASWQAIVNAFQSHFSCPLLVNTDAVETQPNVWNWFMSKGLGWRDDGWSESWEMNTLLPTVIAAAPNQWKIAPVILEPSGTMANSAAWTSAIQWAINNHVSEFSNKSTTIPTALLPAVQNMIAKLGYRFVLTQAGHDSIANGILNINLHWTNKGNAPCYSNQNVLIKIGNKIIDCGHNLKGFLPGSRIDNLAVDLTGINPGNYTVQVGAGPIALAIQGNVGNWYNIGTVTVN